MAHKVRLMHWSGVMRERSESGQSIRRWCQENGVSEKTYHYWQRRLRDAACEKLDELIAPQQTSLAPGFMEVKLPEPTAHKVMNEPTANQLTINIGEIQIIAGSTYSPETLAELLRGLTKPC